MEIIATKRAELKKRTRKLKFEQKIPAVIFGKGLESTPVTVDKVAFNKVYKEAGESSLIDLKLDADKSYKVLVKDVQQDPVSLQPIHINFYKVNLKEKLKLEIPIEIIGQENCEALKNPENLLLVLKDTVEVECLPSDIPAHFQIDISGLKEMDDAITMSAIKYDASKVEILDFNEEELLVKIDRATQEETAEDISEAEAIANLEATSEKPATDEAEDKE